MRTGAITTTRWSGRIRRSFARADNMPRRHASGGRPRARWTTNPWEAELVVDSGTQFLHQDGMILRSCSRRTIITLFYAVLLCAAAPAPIRAGASCPMDPLMEPLHLPHLR